MNPSQVFSRAISSLVVGGGVLLFSTPAQSAIFSLQALNQFNDPLAGLRYVLSGSSGRPLNLISLTSPQFPLTQIDNNNTTQVAASILGGAVPTGSTYSVELNVEDNPDGTAGVKFVELIQILAMANGLEEVSTVVINK